MLIIHFVHVCSTTESNESDPQNLVEMSNIRAKKIERHREKKKIQEKLKELQVAIDKPSADDDVVVSLPKYFYIVRCTLICILERILHNST